MSSRANTISRVISNLGTRCKQFMRAGVQEYSWEFDIAVPREHLWWYVANTNRINEIVGLFDIHYRYESKPGGGSIVHGTATTLGQRLEWIEHPSTWVEPEQFIFTREYTRGPLRRLVNTVELQESDNGLATRLLHKIEVVPSNRLTAPILMWSVGQSTYKGFTRAYAGAEAWYQNGVWPQTQRSKRTSQIKAQIQKQLLAASPDPYFDPIATQLANHLINNADPEIANLYPYRLADSWNENRYDVLRYMFVACHAGALEMQWNLICPSCRRSKSNSATLKELADVGQCDACNIAFEPSFDQRVELSFSPAPLGVGQEAMDYCHSGPVNTPHRIAACSVPAGADVHLQVNAAPGGYHLLSPQCEKNLGLELFEKPDPAATFCHAAESKTFMTERMANEARRILTNHLLDISGWDAARFSVSPDSSTSARVGNDLSITLPESTTKFWMRLTQLDVANNGVRMILQPSVDPNTPSTDIAHFLNPEAKLNLSVLQEAKHVSVEIVGTHEKLSPKGRELLNQLGETIAQAQEKLWSQVPAILLSRLDSTLVTSALDEDRDDTDFESRGDGHEVVAPASAVPTYRVEITPTEIRGLPARMPAGRIDLHVVNHTGVEKAQLLLERSAWVDTAVTAADVTSLADFRYLFAQEEVASGTEYPIEQLTFLYSGLVNDTLDSDRKDHGEILDRQERQRQNIIYEICAPRGAVVKATSEGILAVFSEDWDAARAALEIQREIGAGPNSAALRTGLHSGPCSITKSSNGLDYVGSTLDITTRLMQAAGPGEIALSVDGLDEAARELLHSECESVGKITMIHPGGSAPAVLVHRFMAG